MGGKGSGGYREGAEPWKHSPSYNSGRLEGKQRESFHVTTDMARRLFRLEDVDLTDGKAIEERFFEYLELCDELGCRPLVNGCAMSLGLSWKEFYGIAHGEAGKIEKFGITPSSMAAVQKIYETLSVIWEDFISIEQGSPVKWIFLGKNHFGYSDTKIQISRTIEEQPKLPSNEELQAKYAAKLGVQVPKAELPDGVEVEFEDVEDQ